MSGATGGQEYAAQYTAWTDTLSRLFSGKYKFDPAAVMVLTDSDAPEKAATADNVRKAVNGVRQKMTRDDLFIIVLIGHGTFDGVDAKFNLVGRDLESAEWAALLRPLPGRVVVVNTTAGSFPFIERLAGPRRIVISATDSVAQRFDTVFPEYFVKAFDDESADLDKNQRISVWEAFASASAGVRRHYQQRGQLSTERALIDDNGDGTGRGVAEDGQDGAAASRTYLDAADAARAADRRRTAETAPAQVTAGGGSRGAQDPPQLSARRAVRKGVRTRDDRARESHTRHSRQEEDLIPAEPPQQPRHHQELANVAPRISNPELATDSGGKVICTDQFADAGRIDVGKV